MLTKNAQNYSWRQLAQRAGITLAARDTTGFESLGVHVYYGLPEQISPPTPAIIVAACDERAWANLPPKTPHTLTTLDIQKTLPPNTAISHTENAELPIALWGAGYEDGEQAFAKYRADNVLILYADIIATTFFLLSRWEETLESPRDQHGRFPGTASVAYRQGFLDRPLVDEYALILRAWLQRLVPNWSPQPRHFTVKLTHDIDQLTRRFKTLPQALKTVGGDILKRHNVTYAKQTVADILAQYLDPSQVSYVGGIDRLVNLSQKYGFGNDAFYFMTATSGTFNPNTYRVTMPLVQRYLRTLQTQGFEIGLHPGYHTLNNLNQLKIEKARFDAAVSISSYGGRQHYLRFKVPETWRHWEHVGLAYDSTMGYADHEGFRCGTCHPFRPFDIQQDRELRLWEYPLIVMDNTLAEYRKFTPEQGRDRILALAKRCAQVEGTFTILWHNTTLNWIWEPWAKVYEQALVELATMCRRNF